MKKIITICILSLLMLTGAVHASTYNTIYMNPGPSPSFSVWVKLIITFHRPKLQCKSGFGICFDVEIGTEKSAGSGPDVCPAQARINTAGQLELLVTEEDLLKYENGYALPYFKKGSITIEDPYTFSDPVTKHLGTGRQITINPGSYPVVNDASAHTYMVTFPI
jgi:hypothetical protein